MVAVTLLSGEDQAQKVERLARRTLMALYRKNDSTDVMTILQPSEDGKTTRIKVKCDFTKAANLELFDKHMVPYITDFLAEAEKHDRTGVTQRFSAEAMYAIRTLKSVSVMDIDQISAVLHPKPKVVYGQVFTFPGRNS